MEDLKLISLVLKTTFGYIVLKPFVSNYKISKFLVEMRNEINLLDNI